MFCKYCGADIDNDSKFCKSCGATLDGAGYAQSDGSIRKQTYEGELRKCPNCGDPIDAFELICDKCGYNFSTNRVSSNQEKLATQLRKIDEEQIRRAIKKERKASCISAHPVPNSIEEISSFMMYAGGNIDIKCLATANSVEEYDKGDRKIAEAWIGKMDQMYQLARITFSQEPLFAEIEKIYLAKKREIKRAVVKRFISSYGSALVLVFVFLFLLILFLSLGLFSFS